MGKAVIRSRSKSRGVTAFLLIFFGLVFAAAMPQQVYSADPIRIVVLPYYVEDGAASRDAGDAVQHYRRVIGFMENQLVRHGFEVINPFAADLKESEYNKAMEKSREDSALVCKDMCKRFAADIAYVVTMDVGRKLTSDGYCKVRVRLDGQGYDSAAVSLGATVSKTFKITRDNCDDAIADTQKEVGDLVGRTLTAWSGKKKRKYVKVNPYSSTSGKKAGEGGVLERRFRKTEGRIDVRLDGAVTQEMVEVFGKVINSVRGVAEAKMYRTKIVPDSPQESVVTWRVTIENTEPFRLQSNTIKMINDIVDSGGTIVLKGISYRYTPPEVDLLKGIRAGDTSSRAVHFVIDREKARDKEFSARNDPYEKERDKGFD